MLLCVHESRGKILIADNSSKLKLIKILGWLSTICNYPSSAQCIINVLTVLENLWENNFHCKYVFITTVYPVLIVMTHWLILIRHYYKACYLFGLSWLDCTELISDEKWACVPIYRLSNLNGRWRHQ